MSSNQKVFLRLKNRTRHKKHEIIFHNKTFSFDGILCTNQETIFLKVAKPLTEDFIQGYNCTLLAYGQTGSGKTYTIQGKQNEAGIIQRVLFFLFSTKSKFTIKVSYIEIYNEGIFDLLNEEIKKDIFIREDLDKGIIIDNLNLVSINSYEEFNNVFQKGIQIRKKAQTRNNIESSRSHAIFTVYAEFYDGNIKLKSKYHLVDLAGSERIDVLCSEERQKESGSINKSLLCLSTVIEKLSKKDAHINYRDSKLTFLLKDCLGGNSKLIVIGNIKNEDNIEENAHSKEEKENLESDKKQNNDSFVQMKKMRLSNHYEILNTLKFLDRVKAIENKAYANTELGGDIEDIKREYNELYLKYIELKNRKGYEKQTMQYLDYKSIKQVTKNICEKYDEVVKSCEMFKEKFYNHLDDAYKERMKEIEEMEKFFIEKKR